jgi:hypothetical protein
MVETAILVAFIGIGGTLIASIIGVLSEPLRKKKEREAKREGLRKGLYNELARVISSMYALTGELDLDQRELFPQRTEEEHAKIMLDVFEIFNPTIKNLRVGIYSLAKKDPELAVLFYELREAPVLDAIYEITHVVEAMERLDTKLKWASVRAQLTGLHYRLVTAVKNGLIDRDLLKASCIFPVETEYLEEFLSMPLPPELREDSEETKMYKKLKKRRKPTQ